MDIQAAKGAIKDITCIASLWAYRTNIQHMMDTTPHNDMFDDEINPMWINLCELGALVECRIDQLMPVWNAQMKANGTEHALPWHSADYSAADAKWYEYSLYGCFIENMTFGAGGALYDEEGNEDISDMLPSMAQNPMYV
jgi:hypothetical protein